MNFTDQQKDLLRIMVAKHESNGGKPFIFVNHGLVYPGGDFVRIPHDEFDFRELKLLGLIDFECKDAEYRGRPTARGIGAVRDVLGSGSDQSGRATKDFPIARGAKVAPNCGDPEFWKNRQAEFEKYAKECPDLEADWNAVSEGWWLSKADGRDPLVDCELRFKVEASKAAAGLPGITPDFELWEAWLIAMRLCCADGKPRRWTFEFTRNDRCNELEWDAMQHGKTLAQVRRERGRHPFEYRLGDEDEIYEISQGKLRRLTASELENKSSEDLQKYFHDVQSGRITRVFQASARFCEELRVCIELSMGARLAEQEARREMLRPSPKPDQAVYTVRDLDRDASGTANKESDVDVTSTLAAVRDLHGSGGPARPNSNQATNVTVADVDAALNIRTDRPMSSAAPQDAGSAKRKPGRPATISEEAKRTAAQRKAEGGTNAQVAAILYGTKYPTAQQTKNVPSILRHYHKSKTRIEP